MKKLFSLENLIYLTIFLLPAYLVRFNFFGLPTNLLEILMAIVFLWEIFLKPGFRIFLKPGFRRALGIMFIGLLVSILLNKNYAVGFGIIKGWFILPFVFAMVVKTVIPEEKKKNIFQAYYLSAVGVAVIGLGYYFSGILTFDGRLQVFFNSPNFLAMYLAPAIIIGLWLGSFQSSVFNFQKKPLEKFLRLIMLAFLMVAFYLTYSYAAWAAVFAAVNLTIIVKNQGFFRCSKISQLRDFTAHGLLKMIFIGLFMGMVVFLQSERQKFVDFKNFSERSSLQSRIIIWRSAEKIIQDNWLWGIGPGNFQNKYLEYQKHFPPYLEWAVPHPHSLFLAFWLSGGLLALAGFASLLLAWFKEIFKQEKNALWLASLGIMAYFLLHGLVDTTYFKNDLAVAFWLNFLILL